VQSQIRWFEWNSVHDPKKPVLQHNLMILDDTFGMHTN